MTEKTAFVFHPLQHYLMSQKISLINESARISIDGLFDTTILIPFFLDYVSYYEDQSLKRPTNTLLLLTDLDFTLFKPKKIGSGFSQLKHFSYSHLSSVELTQDTLFKLVFDGKPVYFKVSSPDIATQTLKRLSHTLFVHFFT